MVLEKQFVVNGFGIKEFNGGKVYLELLRYQSYYNPKMSGAFSRGLIKISEWNDRSKSGGSLSVLERGKVCQYATQIRKDTKEIQNICFLITLEFSAELKECIMQQYEEHLEL